MKKQLLAVAAITTVLVAAAPGPKPVITVDGVSAAARLNAKVRAAIAPNVKALNAELEKLLAMQTRAPKATEHHRSELHDEMKRIHEHSQSLYKEIIKQLDPQQQIAVEEYLHDQVQAAGIPMFHAPHGDKAHPPHGERTHIPHKKRTHPPHGKTHGGVSEGVM
jgi:hypothetical protein